MKHRIDKAEFYITNVCNLACPGCNRFNDLKFKGWQSWSDYKNTYARWSEKLDIRHIVVLGGEPTLNPTLSDWLTGLRELWPDSGIQFLTNGRGLKFNDKLYDTCAKTRCFIGISVHHPSFKTELFDQLDNFLVKPYRVNEWVHAPDDKVNGGTYFILDANRVKIRVSNQYQFMPSARIDTPTGYTLHNSDPVAAHSACCHVEYKNYQFVWGKLYKCGPVALFPDLDQQFALEISEEDRQLINSYRPLTVDMLDTLPTTIDEHFATVIPQCKFCPSNNVFHELDPVKILSKISKKT